jgi:predicted kinase
MAGLPGTGKSTSADLLARHLRLPVVDKDDLLELVRQSPIQDEREQGRLAYDLVFSLTSRQLENGVGVIVDTCLAFRWLRDKLADIATAHQARMLIVNCVCDEELVRERITARVVQGLSHRNLSEYERLRDIFETFDRQPDLTIETSADLATVQARITEALGPEHAAK